MTTPNSPAGPASVGASTPASPTTGSTTDGSSTGDAAKEQAQQTAGVAASESKHVAGVATAEAKQVAGDAKRQVQDLMEEAKSQVDEQSRTQRDRLVSTLQELSGQLDGMARGEGAPSGMAQDAVRQVADRARALGSRIDGRDPSDLLEDVRSYARRRPGTFLLGAMAAGLVAGRLAREAKQAPSSDVPGSSGTGSDPLYDDTRGSITGHPTGGTGYPETDPVYPMAGVGDTTTTPHSGPATDPLDPTPGTTTGTGSRADTPETERASDRGPL